MLTALAHTPPSLIPPNKQTTTTKAQAWREEARRKGESARQAMAAHVAEDILWKQLFDTLDKHAKRFDGIDERLDSLSCPTVCAQLTTIGRSIEEVRSLLDLVDNPERECSQADQIATRHLAKVEKKIDQLITLRGELSQIIGRCRGGVAADCRVIESLADHTMCHRDHV